MSGTGKNGDTPNNDGDFDDLIIDRELDFDAVRDRPSSGHDWTAGQADNSHQARYGPTPLIDRGMLEAIARIVESLAGAASDAMPPEARHQLDRTLRELLVAARESIDWLIERLDQHAAAGEVEIEEIPLD